MELENEQEVVEPTEMETEAESEVEVKAGESEEPQAMTMEKLREMANEDIAEDVEAESQNDEEPQAVAYEPVLTYKVKDEEKKFDERLLPAIKDKETEEYIRDLYTKADGLDAYKAKYAEVEKAANDYYNHSQQLTQGFKALQEFRDQGDFDKLQKALGLNDDQVVQWALKRAEEDALPEEQKEIIRKQREQEEKIREYESKVKSYEEMQNDQRVQNDINELKGLVNSEEIRPVAEAMAQRGHNFVEQVLAMGQYEYKRTGKEPSIESVVRKIANQHAYLVEQAKQETASIPQPETKTTERKKAIPSVAGTGQSRASKPKFTSLDALKKYADSL